MESKTTLLSDDYAQAELAEELIKSLVNRPLWWQEISTNIRRLTATIFLLLALAAFAFISFAPFHSYYEKDNNIYTNRCENSAEEAKAKGCTFHLLNYAWQSSACFDKEVYQNAWNRSMEKGPFKWFADANGTEELPQDIEPLSQNPLV
ncbi:hypothetical protein K469DRAFT_767973 [Zopfia rhizophila CBS 207.26]|uniref:Uncharacterized protein n=1 Tax=Zopfia rhizophila CBS 207.26 TaxID=1314779 RepID=A0A6A6EA53_9PEZI|nr:hypothetical protein K469DRAFT_767973 [Zopfia rhizophila CBS 207.26]